MKRIKWIDVLKGFAIIMVVLGHIIKNKYIFAYLYAIHLPIFMFLSGLLFRKNNIKNNTKDKLIGIMVPYLFFSVINMLYFLIFESKFRNINISVMECVKGILLGHYDFLAFNVHLWYLPFFFFVVTIFNVISNFFGERKSSLFLILLGMIYPFIELRNLPYSINRFDLMMFFGLGVRVKNIDGINEFIESDLKNRNIKFLFSLFLFIISFLLVNTIRIKYMNYIIGFLGIISFSLFSKYIEKKDFILNKLGTMTITILCMHGPIYRILIKLVSIITNLSTGLVRSNFMYVVFVASSTLFMCFLLHVALKRLYPPLIGEKTKNKLNS